MTTKLISYEQAWQTIERIEAECSSALEDMAGHDTETLRGRATRLLNCDDPPKGADHDFCLAILGGNVIAD